MDVWNAAAIVSLALVSVGCGAMSVEPGDGDSSPADAGAQYPDAAAADDAPVLSCHAAGTGPVCTDLVARGPGVVPSSTRGALPPPMGGSIADGTYVPTAETDQWPSDGSAVYGVWVIHGNCYESFYGRSPAMLGADTETGTFTTSGTSLTLTVECGRSSSGDVTLAYTANGTRSQIITVGTNSANHALTYTRQ